MSQVVSVARGGRKASCQSTTEPGNLTTAGAHARRCIPPRERKESAICCAHSSVALLLPAHDQGNADRFTYLLLQPCSELETLLHFRGRNWGCFLALLFLCVLKGRDELVLCLGLWRLDGGRGRVLHHLEVDTACPMNLDSRQTRAQRRVICGHTLNSLLRSLCILGRL